MKIHFFHIWGKWSEIETRNYQSQNNPNLVAYVKYIQKRTCQTCGESQVREVAEI